MDTVLPTIHEPDLTRLLIEAVDEALQAGGTAQLLDHPALSAALHTVFAQTIAEKWQRSQPPSDTASPAAVATPAALRYLACAYCGAVYPRTHADKPCGDCSVECPDWQPWDPRALEVPDVRDVQAIVVGLLTLLDESDQCHDADGRLYDAVADALTLVMHDDLEAFRYLILDDTLAS